MGRHRIAAAVVILLTGLTTIATPASAETVVTADGLEVTTNGPNMIVRGTPERDIANINQNGDGSVSVSGRRFPGITGRVQIFLGEGNDQVAINDLDEGFYPSPTIPNLGSLLIDTGPGSFTGRIFDLNVNNNVTVVGSSEGSSMSISQLSVGRNLQFFLRGSTSTANDSVSLSGVDVGDTFTFRQSAGPGRLVTSGLTAANTSINSGRDNDGLFFNNSSLCSAQIVTGNGDDRAIIVNPLGAGSIAVRAGFGTDRVNVVVPGDGSTASRPYSLDIDLGSGSGDRSLIGVPPNSGDRYIGGAGQNDVINFCGPSGSMTGGAVVAGFETVRSYLGACTPN